MIRKLQFGAGYRLYSRKGRSEGPASAAISAPSKFAAGGGGKSTSAKCSISSGN